MTTSKTTAASSKPPAKSQPAEPALTPPVSWRIPGPPAPGASPLPGSGWLTRFVPSTKRTQVILEAVSAAPLTDPRPALLVRLADAIRAKMTQSTAAGEYAAVKSRIEEQQRIAGEARASASNSEAARSDPALLSAPDLGARLLQIDSAIEASRRIAVEADRVAAHLSSHVLPGTLRRMQDEQAAVAAALHAGMVTEARDRLAEAHRELTACMQHALCEYAEAEVSQGVLTLDGDFLARAINAAGGSVPVAMDVPLVPTAGRPAPQAREPMRAEGVESARVDPAKVWRENKPEPVRKMLANA